LPGQESSDGGAVLPHVTASEVQHCGDEHVSLAQIFGRINSGSLILKTYERRGVAGTRVSKAEKPGKCIRDLWKSGRNLQSDCLDFAKGISGVCQFFGKNVQDGDWERGAD
jgi:hypothetical protein